MKANINTKLINMFMQYKKLSKEEFCNQAEIEKDIFDDIMAGNIHLLSIFRMSLFMGVNLDDIILNGDIEG